MSRVAWLQGRALAFDTETTGINVWLDRIVTASAYEVGPTGAVERGHWLVNPGIEIPAAATAIHGISTEKARAEGVSSMAAVPAIARVLREAWGAGLPVIACNASYDLTILNAELHRCVHTELKLGPVLDPLVIDRGADPYRKGKRTLDALAAHYGVKQGAAHSSREDALTAARVVWVQAKRFTQLAKKTLREMQAWQQLAHEAWAANYESYLSKQGKPEEIDRQWPMRQRPEAKSA